MNGVNPALDVIARAKGQVDVPPEDVLREAAWRLDLERYKTANPTLPVPPMLVGIAGKYGSGKSSIICYLVSQLRRYNLFHKVYYFSDSGQLDAKMKEFLPVDNENFHYSAENISMLLGESYKNKGEKPPWEGGSTRRNNNRTTKTVGAAPSRQSSILTSGGVNRGLPGKIRMDGPEVRHALAVRHIKPTPMRSMPNSDRAGAVLPLKERLAKERARVSNKILYIFDDATGQTILKNAREGNPWAPFFTSLRHLGASVIACYHEYKALGTLQRNNMSATVTFKAGNPEELKKIAHESEMSKESYELLMRAVSRIPHAFLGTHRDSRPESERFVLNFQRVIEPSVMEEVIRRERELSRSLRDAGGEEDIRAVFGLGQDAGGTAVLPPVTPLGCVGPDLLSDPSYTPDGLTPRELSFLAEARSLISSVEKLTRPNEPDPDKMAQELGISRAPHKRKREVEASTSKASYKRQKKQQQQQDQQVAVPQIVPTTNTGGSARDHNSSMAAVRQAGAYSIRKPSGVASREAVRRISGASATIGHILRAATGATARAERAAVGAGLSAAAQQQLDAGDTPAVRALINRLRIVRSGRAPRGVVASIGRGVGINLNKITYRTDTATTRAAILPAILRGPRDGPRRPSRRGQTVPGRIAVERSARLASVEGSLLGIRQELEKFKRPPAEEAAKQFEIDRIKLQNQAKLEIEKDSLQREVRRATEEAARAAAAAGQETTQDQLARMSQQVRLLQTEADLKTAKKKAEGPTQDEQRTVRERQRQEAQEAATDANIATARAPFRPPREAFVSAEQLVSAREGLRTTRATAVQKTATAAAEADGRLSIAQITAATAAPITEAVRRAELARAQSEAEEAQRVLDLRRQAAPLVSAAEMARASTALVQAEDALQEAQAAPMDTPAEEPAPDPLVEARVQRQLQEEETKRIAAERKAQEEAARLEDLRFQRQGGGTMEVGQATDPLSETKHKIALTEAETRLIKAEDERQRATGLGSMVTETTPATGVPAPLNPVGGLQAAVQPQVFERSRTLTGQAGTGTAAKRGLTTAPDDPRLASKRRRLPGRVGELVARFEELAGDPAESPAMEVEQ